MVKADKLDIWYNISRRKVSRNMTYDIRKLLILAIIVCLFAILVGPAFSVSLSTGIAFILATGLAIYRRSVIFKEPWLIFLIYTGVIFGYAVSTALTPAIIHEFLHGSIVNGLILLGLYLYLRHRANQIKSGEILSKRRTYR